MEFFNDLLTHPFTIGLGVGLVFALILWIRSAIMAARNKAEISSLERHLSQQMKINNKDNDGLRAEMEDLRQRNSNLQVTNAALKQKAGTAELHTLAVYDKALHIMYGSAPGFSAAWERAVQQAEAELDEADTGARAFLRKVFRPSLKSGAHREHVIDADPEGPADTRISD